MDCIEADTIEGRLYVVFFLLVFTINVVVRIHV